MAAQKRQTLACLNASKAVSVLLAPERFQGYCQPVWFQQFMAVKAGEFGRRGCHPLAGRLKWSGSPMSEMTLVKT
jgi:hypothetical protein